MSPLLEMVNGTFAYRNYENIFENINFSVDKGDIFCILGSNGAGKTTLLKCLNGLMKLSYGEVLFKGKNIKTMDHAELSRGIGYIPQIHNSTFPFTVLDVVLMGRSPHLELFSSPGEKDIKIAEGSLKEMGINHLAQTPYTEISGGEQQLVFIARILTQQPEILILDEPTSHLDFGNQVRTLTTIENLANKGISVVMSSHFPDQTFLSGTKVALMQEKNFLEVGSPKKVITKENMEELYGIPVEIVDLPQRRACIPLKKLNK